MADVVETTTELQYKLTLRSPENSTTRTIAIPAPGNNTRDEILSFRSSLMGDYNTFFQPTSWEDTETDEEVYTVSACSVTHVTTTKIEYDTTATDLKASVDFERDSGVTLSSGDTTSGGAFFYPANSDDTISITSATITPVFTPAAGSSFAYSINNNGQIVYTLTGGTATSTLTFSTFTATDGTYTYGVDTIEPDPFVITIQ